MRVRVRYEKLGKIRFTSHRDTARHWERAVRKAGVAVSYSAGFTPRPRMSFGLALPTGAESVAEFLDIDLESLPESAADADALCPLFDSTLPPGYAATRVAEIQSGTPSLQDAVVACTWHLDLVGVGTDDLADCVARVMAASSVMLERERKGQRSVDDVRPAILSLDLASPTGGDVTRAGLVATLATTSRGLRPLELVAALLPALDPVDATGRVLRTHQMIDVDGAIRELLPLDAVGARARTERG
ncbi:MAG: hypothetical protein RJB61_1132 [Actinomycetota bacterium]